MNIVAKNRLTQLVKQGYHSAQGKWENVWISDTYIGFKRQDIKKTAVILCWFIITLP